ncbi:hypothetical protein [Flectobacillus roseus]|uniref:Uncharacterized protein n=1 Tax=Flectobacillus roseus TaxID=502259 RepID=A0ABT6Y2X9_9BACT|nr:hypothetical protein [Flectobacillus roseus]MDI9857881.1 hypothetical protein [Flectobacillus roseus]
MNWSNIVQQIKDSIKVGDKLQEDLTYRYFIAGPDFSCNDYDYNGELGYKIQIGKNNCLQIPFLLLKTVFEDTLANNGIYNRKVICKHYQKQVTNHGCHVHVVGRIFAQAGIMQEKDKRTYQITAT